jgi:hypothetical protein
MDVRASALKAAIFADLWGDVGLHLKFFISWNTAYWNRAVDIGCWVLGSAATRCVDGQGCNRADSVPELWSSRSISSRAFLNSFMLCPKLRAKSGNFFAPKRTRTMRRMINRSGPARFPIPNARIFITILNWLGLILYSPEPEHILFNAIACKSYRVLRIEVGASLEFIRYDPNAKHYSHP